MKTDIEQQKAGLDNEFAYHNFTNSELEKITSEFGAEKESHAATLSGSQSLTAELEAERANLAVQVNELSALKEQHTG